MDTHNRQLGDSPEEDPPDQAPYDQVITEVYDELRRIARIHRRTESYNLTLQTTALVHEAWLRLAEGDAAPKPQSEAHFKALTSRVIRNVLVDYVRRATADKRQPGPAELHEISQFLIDPKLDVGLLDLDRALHGLGRASPRLALLVEYRFFGGMSIPETAEVMEVSERTVERDWRKARAYLLQRLRDTGD